MPIITDKLKADLVAIYQEAKSSEMTEEEFAQKMAEAIDKQILNLTIVAIAPLGGGPCQVTIS